MTEPTPKDITNASLTKAGYWDGFTLKTGLTQRGREAGSAPEPEPEVPVDPTNPFAPKMQYGVSGTTGSWPTGYMNQVNVIHAKNGLFYGQDTRWSQIAGAAGTGIPDDHDIWVQTKATTRAQYDAMIASFPATRVGKVFLFHWNEPESEIKTGPNPPPDPVTGVTPAPGFTIDTWAARQDALFAAIDAAPASKRAYIVKGLCIQFYDLRQFLRGNLGTNQMFNMTKYMRPGTAMINWSAYNDIGTATTGSQIKSWLAANYPGVGYSIVTGWQLVEGTPQFSDPAERVRRINWMRDYARALSTQGCRHFQWFDLRFNGKAGILNYLIEVPPGPDQTLEDAWIQMLQEDGEW